MFAAGGIPIPMAVWQQPKHSYDADRIKTLDSLHQVLQVIFDPPSLTYLRDSFRTMRGYKQEQHPLHDQHEGFHDVYRAILVRANELTFTLSAGRFHHKRE